MDPYKFPYDVEILGTGIPMGDGGGTFDFDLYSVQPEAYLINAAEAK